jgi:hypothetical protein
LIPDLFKPFVQYGRILLWHTVSLRVFVTN